MKEDFLAFPAPVQREIGNAQKQALLRLTRRGIISEHVYTDFVAGIDAISLRTSGMDRILPAELRNELASAAARAAEVPPSSRTDTPEGQDHEANTSPT